MLGKLILAEKPYPVSAEETTDIILDAIREEGLNLLNWSREVEMFRARALSISTSHPNNKWPELTTEKLLENIEDWLVPILGKSKNRNDLKRLNLLAALQSLFNWKQRQQLDRLAPEQIKVTSGSNIRIQYKIDGQPVLAVKLQEMFGQADTPRIADGRIALQLHLLSPAGRPLQVTQDLRSFWNDVYPEIKKEMRGRYPKHPWPDDPWNAIPTRHTNRRLNR